jgi:hypothetical protein
MESQFLKFKSTELDKPIYKVLKFDYLVEMFQNNLNTLLNPSIWDDPYENLFMESKIEITNGLFLKSELGKSIFCQSWSFTKDSDAMWRIYSPDNNSVKISSTPRKLLKSLTEIDQDLNKVFIGKVNYLKSTELKSLYLNNSKKWVFEELGIGNAKSLLYKRYPFKHENEVRLIYNTFINAEKKILKYTITPNDLIDNIVFDPRLKYSEFRKRKDFIKELGYNKTIIKSNLYKMPNYNIIKSQ